VSLWPAARPLLSSTAALAQDALSVESRLQEVSVDFEYTRTTKDLLARLQAFIDEHIYPNEAAFYRQHDEMPNRWQIPPMLEELKAKARKANLWNLFLPESDRGAGHRCAR
jgi:alkylation response protein AidB-like acyl-CoA dehydrogenase